MNQGRRYLSYLLRLWQERGGEARNAVPLWRASLERPRSGERMGFASLADLFAFLESETGTDSQRLESQDEERSPG